MAEPHAHSQPIQTYGPAPHNRNIWPSPTPTANQYKHMAQRRIIETYGLAPRPQPTNTNIWPSAHNRNIWPHNSRAPPSRLADSFVLQVVVYPLLPHHYYGIVSIHLYSADVLKSYLHFLCMQLKIGIILMPRPKNLDVLDTNIFPFVTMHIYSFIHYGDLYSTSSRLLLRIPIPIPVPLIEQFCGWSRMCQNVPGEQSLCQRKPIPHRRANHRECTALPCGSRGKRDKEDFI